jgi:peptidoglycan/LPS O-acetylase OafA/YrhL
MYIFHWGFVVAVAERQEQWSQGMGTAMGLASGFGVIVAGILATYVVAWLSYRFIEAPFLKIKERFHD